MFGKKTIAIAAATLALAAGVVHGAQAGPRHGGYGQYGYGAHPARIQFRIHKQKRRIRRARRQGRLTRGEARLVRFNLSRIRRVMRRYMWDDHMSRREKRHLVRMLNRNSRRIFRLSHNRRYGWNDRRL